MVKHVAACLLLACSLTCQTAWGSEDNTSYPARLIDDTQFILSAPVRWERNEWQDFGLASLAIVTTAALIDRPLRDEMRRHPGNDPTIKRIERFGADYSLYLLGGFYVAGKMSENERAVEIAEDGLTASIIASGIVTPTLKYLFGRSRPYQNAGDYNFRPFSNLNASFPSGHTTEAFALASVIANQYDESWISWTSYSIAGMVGLARSYHNAHYASDILAGAMIGTVVGRSVVEHHRQGEPGRLSLQPAISTDRVGLNLTGSF